MVLQTLGSLESQEGQPSLGRGEKPTHHGLHHQGRRGLHHRHRGVQGTCHFFDIFAIFHTVVLKLRLIFSAWKMGPI